MITRQGIKKVGVVLVILLTLTPGLVHITDMGRQNISLEENRTLSRLPGIDQLVASPRAFTQGVSGYLDDNFGGRSFAIRVYNKIKDVMDRGNAQMVRGRTDNWMFLAYRYNWDTFRGRRKLNAADIAKWNRRLENLRSQSETNRSVFLSGVAPYKNRIYPEQVPRRYGMASDFRLIDAFDFDLRIDGHLHALKSDRPAYYQTDTHWTHAGAYEMYLAAMSGFKARGLSAEVLPRTALIERDVKGFSGDLVSLAGLDKVQYAESFTDISAPLLQPRPDRSELPSPSGDKSFKTLIWSRSDINGPTLVILGDSSALSLMPFFIHSFQTVIRVHHEEGGFDFDKLLAHNPDAVLFLPSEGLAELLLRYDP